MIFQTLDDKQECVGVYKEGNLIFPDIVQEHISNGDVTWSYAAYLDGVEVEYAQLYCGTSIDAVCPDSLRQDWDYINNRLKAFVRSFVEAKISLEEVCFYDLVPASFLQDYCEIKNNICEYVFNNYARPENYEHLLGIKKLTHKIANQKLEFSWSNLRTQMHRKSIREQMKKYKSVKPYCQYNIFGTKTGRLTTMKNSFPILTLPKEMRSVLKPTVGSYFSLDYNGAEVRTLLALAGSEQPTEDIHEWNRVNVFENTGTREEAKKRFFSWLYNPSSTDSLPNRFYDRNALVKKHWNGRHVVTPFNRTIEVDERKALNYLIQSTTSDIVMEQAIKLDKVLEDCKSRIAFIIHDEIILDVHPDEEHRVDEFKDIFANTRYGKFMVGSKNGI